MKRDWELIRSLLLAVEASGFDAVESNAFTTETVDEKTVAEHMALLHEAGLVEVNLLSHESTGALAGSIERLTWQGHEFLDTIREQNVWNRTRQFIRERGVPASFEGLKLVASTLLKKSLEQ